MRKNYLRIHKPGFIFFFIQLLFTGMVQAQTYHEDDIHALKNFLLQPCHPDLPDNKNNGFIYNFHAMANRNDILPEDLKNTDLLISILQGVTFENSRITKINWGGGSGIGGFAGELDLSPCQELKEFDFRMSANNHIHTIILDGRKLEEINIQGTEDTEPVLEKFILSGIESGEYLPGDNPHLYCYGNKLKFNSMPKIIVESSSGRNQYYCAGQQDSINTEGNLIGELINLHTDYFFEDVQGKMWDESYHNFGSTQYTWKKGEKLLQPDVDYLSLGNGYFTFINNSLSEEEVICEITHDLFRVNTLFYQLPGLLSGNTSGEYNNLTLRYVTKLHEDTKVNLHTIEEEYLYAYFSGNTFIIRNPKEEKLSVSVYDTTGNLLSVISVRPKEIVRETNAWQPGMYLVRSNSGKKTVTQKIIKK